MRKTIVPWHSATYTRSQKDNLKDSFLHAFPGPETLLKFNIKLDLKNTE